VPSAFEGVQSADPHLSLPKTSYHNGSATIRIPEAEAARDLPALLAKVRAGAEIIIESGAVPAAILRSESPTRRTVSECIEIARKHEQESGEIPILDPDFAEDVADVIRNRKPWTPPVWE